MRHHCRHHSEKKEKRTCNYPGFSTSVMLSALPINSQTSFYATKFAWYHFVLFITFNYELRKQNNKDLVIFGVALGAVSLNI